LEVGTGFHAELTGRDNIYLSGAILGMKKAEIDRKFDTIVEFSEIGRFIDTPVKHYSSGMYVKLGFAVAAHMEPDILIVDEVLAVGDGRFQQKCMGKLQDVGRHGQTVIFVSHDVSAVTRLCNRAILLDSGRVAKDGPAHEVVGEYLYGSDSRRPSQEWLDPSTAPRNEIVRMCAVRVRTEEGLVKDSVDLSRPVGVEIEFEVLQPGHVLVPCFGFRNEEGASMFEVHDRDTVWLRRPRPIGRYASTAWIPGNFLSEGTIIVGGGVITEAPFHLHCDAPEVVAFHVVESADEVSARGDYTGNMLGAVRPLLKWTTKFSSHENR
jgi:lipopolysaccharide transport system ATP-binding protein